MLAEALKWEDAKYVYAPILTDCPVSIECSVVESTKPGTEELFIGKVEAVHVDEEYLDAKGNILWDKMKCKIKGKLQSGASH